MSMAFQESKLETYPMVEPVLHINGIIANASAMLVESVIYVEKTSDTVFFSVLCLIPPP